MNDVLKRNPDSKLALMASWRRFGGSFGIDPVRLLKLRSSRLRPVAEFNVFGKMPERELWDMSMDSKDLSVKMEGGTEPENELNRRVRVWRFMSEEREGGIGPKKLFSDRSR